MRTKRCYVNPEAEGKLPHFPTELNRNLAMGTAPGQEILMRRFGSPGELVGLAVLLSSDAVSFLTGQCIAVDGAYLASGGNS